MRDKLGRFVKGIVPANKKGKGIDGVYFKVYTADGRRIRLHRYIMEKHLGRKLQRNEIVHHINWDPSDNRIENLVIMSRSEHNRVHILPKRWGGVYV